MKFRLIVLVVMIFCLAAGSGASAYEAEIKKMSATMAEKIAGTEKAKIAVVDFTDLQGDVTELGRFLAEEFSVALAGAGKGFKIVDRTHLKSIIKENKLSATGLIDPETARKLGKIAGVDALITGTLTPFGDTVRIAVKILDASSAEVIDAITGNIAKTEVIKSLLATNIIRPAGENPPQNKQKNNEYEFKLFANDYSLGDILFDYSNDIVVKKSSTNGNYFSGRKIGSSFYLNNLQYSGDFNADISVWFQTSPEHEITLDFDSYTARLKLIITWKDVAYDGKVIFAGRESWHKQTTWDWRKKKLIRFEKKGGVLKLFFDDDVFNSYPIDKSATLKSIKLTGLTPDDAVFSINLKHH